MKKILTLALTVSCVVGLAGCAVQPVQLTEEQSRLLASTWSYGEGTAEAKSLRVPPAQWWSSWKDPSLNMLVEATLKNNTDIAQAQANLRSAMASLTAATSQLFPTATLGADGARNRRNNTSTESFGADAAAAGV